MQLSRALLLVLVAVPLAVGCSTRMGDLTIASNRNVSLDAVDLDSLPSRRRVEGRSTKFVFLFIPFGIPRLEEAIDDALDRGQGDVMTDISIHSTGWWFLVGQTGIVVKGDVIDTRQRQTP